MVIFSERDRWNRGGDRRHRLRQPIRRGADRAGTPGVGGEFVETGACHHRLARCQLRGDVPQRRGTCVVTPRRSPTPPGSDSAPVDDATEAISACTRILLLHALQSPHELGQRADQEVAGFLRLGRPGRAAGPAFLEDFRAYLEIPGRVLPSSPAGACCSRSSSRSHGRSTRSSRTSSAARRRRPGCARRSGNRSSRTT